MDNWIRKPILREKDNVSSLLNILKDSGAFIAGGFARYVFSENPLAASDIDVFTGNQLVYDVAKLALDKLATSDYYSDHVEETQASLKYDLDCISLPVNLIKPNPAINSQGNKEFILSLFDMTICEAIIEDENTVLVSPACLNDLAAKQIRFTNLSNLPNAFLRAFKYASKGFEMPTDEINKLLTAYGKLTPDQMASFTGILNYIAAGFVAAQEDVEYTSKPIHVTYNTSSLY